jgi:hypothetical protein
MTMADLDRRFRGLDRTASPDLWPDIESREPRSQPSSRGRQVAVAAVALAVAAGGVALAVRAFLGGEPTPRTTAEPAASPAAPVEPVVDVTLPIKFPASIVYGEGSVWVAASANDGTEAGTVYRIDPDTAEILAEIPSPVVPGWETGGGAMEVAEGNVWVAGGGSSSDLVRIDAGTNRVAAEFQVAGSFLGDVAVDDQGVWVSVFGRDEGGDQRIFLVRLDPGTGQEEARIPMESSYAREVLAVQGTVWLHERITHGSTVAGGFLTRIDPGTGRIVASVRVPGAAMVTDGDGFIWVPTWTSGGGNLLVRVDPHTGAVVRYPSGPLEFVIDVGGGGVWGVARRGQDLFEGRGGIVRFDPVTGQVDAGVEVDAGTIALAVAPGSVWTIAYEGGATRIELRPA